MADLTTNPKGRIPPQLQHAWDFTFPDAPTLCFIGTEFIGDPEELNDGIEGKHLTAQEVILIGNEGGKPLMAAIGWSITEPGKGKWWANPLDPEPEAQQMIPTEYYISRVGATASIATRSQGALTVTLPHNLCGTKPFDPNIGDLVNVTSSHMDGLKRVASAWSYTRTSGSQSISWPASAQKVSITGTNGDGSLTFGDCDGVSVMMHSNQKECTGPFPDQGDEVMAVLSPNQKGLKASAWWTIVH